MDIFKLVGSIYVDNTAANDSLQKTDKKAEGVGSKLQDAAKKAVKFGAGLATAAGTGAAALYKVSSDSAAAADNIDKMSQRLGLSREAYQELDFAMSQSGVEVESFQTGMKSLLKNMDAVSEGNATSIENFDKLKVSVQNADGSLRDQEDVLWDTIRAFQEMEESSEKSRLAQELFGKQGQEILPMLNDTAGGIDAMRQQAHDLGLVLSDETIDAGVKFTDTSDQMKRSMESVMTQVGAGVMPIIQQLLEWVITHMPEIQAIFQIVFGVISVIVTAFGDAIGWLQGVFATNMPAIQGFFGSMAEGIGKFWDEHLKPCFDAISQFIQNVLAPAFSDVFEYGILPTVQAVFKGIEDFWNDGLKPVFTGIIDFITGVFSGDWEKAWNGIVELFSGIFGGIVAIVKVPLNTIIGSINSVFSSLGSLEVPDWVPGIGGTSFSLPQIPLLAKGGQAFEGGTAIVGEAGAELIELPRGARVTPLNDNNNAFSETNKKLDTLIELMATMIAEMKAMRNAGVYIDGDTLVGRLAPRLDRMLGMYAELAERNV